MKAVMAVQAGARRRQPDDLRDQTTTQPSEEGLCFARVAPALIHHSTARLVQQQLEGPNARHDGCVTLGTDLLEPHPSRINQSAALRSLFARWHTTLNENDQLPRLVRRACCKY